MKEMAPKKIIVIGGGFAGINFLKRLRGNPNYEITLVDKNNFHLFPPLLYQVAMAFIDPSNICYPFRRMFQRKSNIRFHMGCLQEINTAANTIETDSGVLGYDYLILATGTVPNYFGMENVKKNSWPLKTISDATNLRNHLLLNIEKAIRCDDPEEKKALLNVVIAGGGPTGVEVAGMLAEMVRNIGPKEYPEVMRGSFRIYLIEAAPVLLGPMSKKAQQEALDTLKALGVNIMLNTAVKDFVDGKVILANGETIATHALLWTSGVIAAEANGIPADSLGKSRRLLVDDFNKVNNTNNIFAIGDISLNLHDKRYPNGHPQLAQVAIQQGRLLANNFITSADGRQWKPFRYHDKGTLAIIAKYRAVGDLPSMFLKGLPAWVVWLFIHLLPLTGFRNKMSLTLSWAWAFFTNDPTLRLILRPDQKEFTSADKNRSNDPIQARQQPVKKEKTFQRSR